MALKVHSVGWTSKICIELEPIAQELLTIAEAKLCDRDDELIVLRN